MGSLPLALLAATVLPLLAGPLAPPGAPAVRDHFPDPGAPNHTFLLVDGETGETLRAEGDSDDPVPWDGMERILVALTGLESGALDAAARVRCDSTCWADGGHGEPDLIEGLALDCDTWFASARRRVGDERWRDRAAKLDLLAGTDGSRTTVRAWTGFWRKLTGDRLGLPAAVTTELLGAAGIAVSSPRGSARTLYDLHRHTRAFVVASREGAWALGSRRVLGREWVFALHLPGGSAALAAARADQMIEDTRQVARQATSARGGMPIDDPE